MKITFLGHACFLVEVNSQRLLFDPYISPNPLAQSIDLDGLQVDYMLLSHGHYDHVADVETIYRQCAPTIVANLEMINWYKKRGIEKLLSINPGGKRTLPGETVVKAVHEPHASSMPDGSYAGSALGFIVQGEGKTFYFAGDTALHQDMKQIGEFHTINFAMLPIGGILTMDLEEALHAAHYVDTPTIIGMHYDTFEDIEIDHQQALQQAEAKDKQLILMKIGETIDY